MCSYIYHTDSTYNEELEIMKISEVLFAKKNNVGNRPLKKNMKR